MTQAHKLHQFPSHPDLFSDRSSTRMASALPIWEASSILTQRGQLPWSNDPEGKLRYAREIGNGQGALHFWVTEDLEDEFPVPLAGAAALAVVDAFDIRAACMHLIYAAHATQFEKPWEQEFVIDDRQIEAYLGLKKRTDKNRQEKLALIEELAKQPCKITTYISYPRQGKVKGFTLEEGRLWHLMGTRYHYQQNLLGNKELVGITFILKAGLWARYFLNEEGHKTKSAYYQAGVLPQAMLETVMSVWQHREGAARLMVWLLFKTQFSRQLPLTVQTLMEVAYGREKVEQAKRHSEFRKKLANTWDEDLLTLHDRGWKLQFEPTTYPLEIQPPGFGRENLQRPRGFFDQLLAAQLWISLEEGLETVAPAELNKAVPQPLGYQSELSLTGTQVKQLRMEKGWSQRKFAKLTGMSQGLISLIENEERVITPESEAIFKQTFEM
ncbi:helix-turn-helix transcriptional regulator [Phormidium tenue FACHB-886]|nr:helix-turn-helix transcriptional regulator [Phormidium tenue FACHB-886]